MMPKKTLANRLRFYSIRTDKAYIPWDERFVRF
jgi:hypothetical protein